MEPYEAVRDSMRGVNRIIAFIHLIYRTIQRFSYFFLQSPQISFNFLYFPLVFSVLCSIINSELKYASLTPEGDG